jgi:hypothetical protein
MELALEASRLPIVIASGFGNSEGLAGGMGGVRRLFYGVVSFVFCLWRQFAR